MSQKLTTACVASLIGILLAGCGGGGGGQAPDPGDPGAGTASLPTIILPGPIPPDSPAPPTGDAYAMSLAIPPRLQWTGNSGYCGEVSFISAGLYYGQYVSQYAARAAASPGVDQSDPSSQLLIAVNDQTAAANLHLTAVEWNGSSSATTTAQFLAWVKGYVLAGRPVVIGLYTNMSVFGDGSSPGFTRYDHIVPVTGIASNHPLVQGLDQVYYDDDLLQFSDDLGYNNPNYPNQADDPPAAYFMFQFGFGPFQMTRTQANAETAPLYALTLHQGSDTQNAGVAITGVVDLDNETVPVRLATDLDHEFPAIVDGSNAAPAAQPLTLTATVYGLTVGVTYNVYQYDSLAAIPNSAFNANAAAAVHTVTFTATSSTYVLPPIAIQSNQVAAFRAVPASAR